MSDSIERVEQWGEALAELSNAFDAHRIDIMKKKEGVELPKGFKMLEDVVASCTPETISHEIIKHIGSVNKRIHIIHYSISDDIKLPTLSHMADAFILSSRNRISMWFNRRFVISSQTRIRSYLPVTKNLFHELEVFGFKPSLEVYFGCRLSLFFALYITIPKY